jgi:integrase
LRPSSDRRRDGFVFGPNADRAFAPTSVRKQAAEAWRAAGLEPLTLHERRHTCASPAIGAGVTANALCSYMGHSSIQVTYDKYGDLMPGNENKAEALLDACLARAADSV